MGFASASVSDLQSRVSYRRFPYLGQPNEPMGGPKACMQWKGPSADCYDNCQQLGVRNSYSSGIGNVYNCMSIVEKRRCHVTLGTVNNVGNKIKFRNVFYCPGIRLFFEWKCYPIMPCVLSVYANNVCTNKSTLDKLFMDIIQLKDILTSHISETMPPTVAALLPCKLCRSWR
jgi:hypothetical protein